VDHDAHRQVELAGEVEVALVVGGHRHDRAVAVVGQHVVGGPDRDALAVDRVDGVAAQEDAGLLLVGGQALDVAELGDLGAVGLEGGALLVGDDLVGQRGVHGDHEERGAEERVGAGGEDGDRLLAALDLEHHVGALGPADPVALHGQQPLGPVLELVHVVQQALRVVSDLEVPLRQLAPDDLGAAALAPAGHDLLVGQHRLVVGAPVDQAALAVGQAALEEAVEQPLVPVEVLGVAGVEAPRPVEGDGVPLERVGLRLDVAVGPLGGVGVALDRGVLRGQAEGVPADRVQHVVAALEPVARDDVPDREDLAVAHVKVARRVGEHVEHVAPLTGVGGVLARPERVHLLPARQPLGLQRLRVVLTHGGRPSG
jgi:hypothetical protein